MVVFSVAAQEVGGFAVTVIAMNTVYSGWETAAGKSSGRKNTNSLQIFLGYNAL